jgi:hypothetical protein
MRSVTHDCLHWFSGPSVFSKTVNSNACFLGKSGDPEIPIAMEL